MQTHFDPREDLAQIVCFEITEGVSQFCKRGTEKQGFLTGLEIFILLFLQLEGFMGLPRKGDIWREEGKKENGKARRRRRDKEDQSWKKETEKEGWRKAAEE